MLTDETLNDTSIQFAPAQAAQDERLTGQMESSVSRAAAELAEPRNARERRRAARPLRASDPIRCRRVGVRTPSRVRPARTKFFSGLTGFSWIGFVGEGFIFLQDEASGGDGSGG
jgi:hypothetical protein